MANSTVRALNRRLHQFATDIEGVSKTATDASALALTTSVAGFLGGRSIRLSGVGKNGSKVGVRYNTKGTANPTALVFMFGPAQLIERDTRAHEIIGRKVGRRRKGVNKHNAKQALYSALFGGSGGGRLGAGHLNTDSGWGTGPFHHPGTQGKHPWAKGLAAVRDELPKIYDRGITAAGRRIFH